VTNDAFLLDRLTDFVVAFVASAFPECQSIFGVPEGATKTAVISALKWAQKSPAFAPGSHVIAMGRAQPKLHGASADRDYIGLPLGPTVVIEDTATTGGSLLGALNKLQEAHVKVVGCVALSDREQRGNEGLTVAEALKAQFGPDLRYQAMAGALSLIPEAARRRALSPRLKAALEQEFEAYGVAPLTWSGHEL
jgi:orotate phosphoribosyltransferase